MRQFGGIPSYIIWKWYTFGNFEDSFNPEIVQKEVKRFEFPERKRARHYRDVLSSLIEEKSVYEIPGDEFLNIAHKIPQIIQFTKSEDDKTCFYGLCALADLSYEPLCHPRIYENCDPFQLAIDFIEANKELLTEKENGIIACFRLLLRLTRHATNINEKSARKILNICIWAAKNSLKYEKIVSLAFACLTVVISSETRLDLRERCAKEGMVYRCYEILVTSFVLCFSRCIPYNFFFAGENDEMRANVHHFMTNMGIPASELSEMDFL